MTWYEIDKARLVLEFLRVKSQYKTFRLKRNDKELFWEGELIISVGGCDADPLQIQVIYREAFPSIRPTVIVLNPPLDPSEVGHDWHRWADGSVCYIRPNEWEISTTADEVIAKTADWYFNYVAVKRALIPSMPEIGRADLSRATQHA